jgi:hypothetical protein
MNYRSISFVYHLLIIFILTTFNSYGQNVEDSIKIKLLYSMDISSSAWNKGDLEGFMHNYWKSDSTRFVSRKGVIYGWQNTLDNYKKSYPDKEIMGKLKFDIISIEYLGPESILMLGRWQCTRKKDIIEGPFSLIWKRKGDNWYIIFDHSS